MRAYQCNEYGAFIGLTTAQESPLEPGVFLLPGGCTFVEPMPCAMGYEPIWNEAEQQWIITESATVPKPNHMQLEPELTTEAYERNWRDMQLAIADVELNKVLDGEGYGTEEQWREYRKELRKWPEHKNFPSEAFRPELVIE